MNAVALYSLKQESQFNAIQSPTRLVAAPARVWHAWLAPTNVVDPRLKVQELEPAADVQIQLAAKDQQIEDLKSQFARLEELIAAETAAREKDIEQFKKDHREEIEQLKKDHREEIEQLKKDHREEIEQLKKDHREEIEQLKKEIEQQGKRVALLETEVEKHKETIATVRASEVAFHKNFTTAIRKSASTSRVRTRSSTRAVAEQEKRGGEEEHDGEEEPRAKKARREEEHDE